jgi:hypothetical protein
VANPFFLPQKIMPADERIAGRHLGGGGLVVTANAASDVRRIGGTVLFGPLASLHGPFVFQSRRRAPPTRRRVTNNNGRASRADGRPIGSIFLNPRDDESRTRTQAPPVRLTPLAVVHAHFTRPPAPATNPPPTATFPATLSPARPVMPAPVAPLPPGGEGGTNPRSASIPVCVLRVFRGFTDSKPRRGRPCRPRPARQSPFSSTAPPAPAPSRDPASPRRT